MFFISAIFNEAKSNSAHDTGLQGTMESDSVRA